MQLFRVLSSPLAGITSHTASTKESLESTFVGITDPGSTSSYFIRHLDGESICTLELYLRPVNGQQTCLVQCDQLCDVSLVA